MKQDDQTSGQNHSIGFCTVSLGLDGLSFICSELKNGGPLSHLVGAQLGDEGKAFALVPENTTIERAKQFSRGGLVSIGSSHNLISQSLAKEIAHLEGSHSQLIFEDPWMKPTDFKKLAPKLSHFQNGETKYYAPDSRELASALNTGLQEIRSFLRIGFAINPHVAVHANGEDVGVETLMLMAQRIQAVFVSAYDRESYVVWLRKP